MREVFVLYFDCPKQSAERVPLTVQPSIKNCFLFMLCFLWLGWRERPPFHSNWEEFSKEIFPFLHALFYCLAVCVSIKIVAVQFLSSLASIIIRLFHNVLPTINKLPLLLPYNTCFEEHSKLRLRHTFGTRKRTLSIIISQKRTLLLKGHYCKLDSISTIANNRRILEERKSASLLRLSAKKTTQNTHKLGQLRRHF